MKLLLTTCTLIGLLGCSEATDIVDPHLGEGTDLSSAELSLVSSVGQQSSGEQMSSVIQQSSAEQLSVATGISSVAEQSSAVGHLSSIVTVSSSQQVESSSVAPVSAAQGVSSVVALPSSIAETYSSQSIVIPEYSTSVVYSGGDVVSKDGVVYQCKTGATVPWCNNPAYVPGGIYFADAWDIVSGDVVVQSSNSVTVSSNAGVSSSATQQNSSAVTQASSNSDVTSGNGWSAWTKRSSKKTVIGYYAGWQWYDRAKKAAPAAIDYSKWTRVNFAFFHPSSNGDLHVTDEWADAQVLFGPANWNPGANDKELCLSKMSVGADAGTETCGYYQTAQGLIELAHAAGTEIWPSIGGWTLSDKFPAIAASPTATANFVAECVRLLREYNFDGIDIDWEYPGYVDHSGTSADKVNYVTFLRAIKAGIDAYGNSQTPKRSYGLTAALPCGESIIDGGVDVPALNNILTEFNLMTYDFHGAFDAKADHNSALYDNGIHPESPRFNVSGCVDNYVERGATIEKLNVGGGFYGRSFAGATVLGGTHTGTDTQKWVADEGTPMYYNIKAQLNSGALTRHWDDVAKVPYATFAGGGLVSYEDEESMRIKSEFINTKNIGGIIIWEMSGDIMDDLSTPLLDVVHSVLNQ